MPENNEDAIVAAADDVAVVTDGAAPAEGAAPVTLADKVQGSDPGPGGAGGEGAKSLAEALNAGLDSAPKKGEKKPADAVADTKGKAGEDKTDGEAETDEQKAAREAAEKEAKDKKDPDHINDPIDERLSERAQDRIRSLVGFVKERDEALTIQGNLIKSIQDTGASPEQFAEIIGFLRDANSNTPEGLERAYQMLRTGLRTISLQLGKPIPEVDLLADHADLAQAVKFGQITKAHADELALAREQTKFANANRAAAEKRTKETSDAKTERDTAISELNALGAELKKSDPDYEKKFDLIVPALKAAFEGMRPAEWKAAFTKAYTAFKLPAASPPADPTKVVPGAAAAAPAAKKPTPIRPTAPAGGGGAKPAPKSLLEALSSGIELAR